MAISIYDPQVRAYAERHGVTDLQAYRALNARETLKRRIVSERSGMYVTGSQYRGLAK